MENILIIIPAKIKSKDIPNKNIRILNGKPLIYYSIQNALALKKYFNVDICVDTDSEEIMDIATLHGVDVHKRQNRLTKDDVMLDPVVYEACNYYEKKYSKSYDTVITMQAIVPTLLVSTLVDAVRQFDCSNCDTLISCIEMNQLLWTDSCKDNVPNYCRLNQEKGNPLFVETGAFLITKRSCINRCSRIGKHVDLYRLSLEESIDIHNYINWNACRTILKRKKIMFRCDSDNKLGMGHIYRCLSIACHLTEHEVVFIAKKNKALGIKKIQESAFSYKTISNNEEFYKLLEEEKPDIVVNDILNTDKEYITRLKELVPRIVNFEDQGLGASFADCVINSLYGKQDVPNVYSGYKYYFIRDEFLEISPHKFNEDVKSVLFTFGGSDPLELTTMSYKAIKTLAKMYSYINYNIIVGSGNKQGGIISVPELNINVFHDVKHMSKYMKKSDLAVSSCGRTVYELAYMTVPTITIAQNKREILHKFACQKNGFINLGYGKKLDEETLISTIDWLIRTPQIRREMYDSMRTKDFTQGQRTVINLILGRWF